MITMPEQMALADIGQWEAIIGLATKGFEVYSTKKAMKKSLKAEAVPEYTPPAPAPVTYAPVATGPNWGLIAAVGGGAVVLLGLGAFLLLRK